MKISNQYSEKTRFIAENSGKKHPLFEGTRPLTVQEMFNRAMRGLPLSTPIPPQDRIPINDKFFVDGFDVLDAAIANNFRISKEEKQKQLAANEQFKKEQEEFKQWKLEQQKQHVQETSI